MPTPICGKRLHRTHGVLKTNVLANLDWIQFFLSGMTVLFFVVSGFIAKKDYRTLLFI
jgi:hypothetical protein